MAMIENATDREKYEEIYSGYRDYMYCVAISILGDRDAAEDIVKQAFEYIAQHLDEFGSDGTMYGVREQVARVVARMAKGNWGMELGHYAVPVIEKVEDEDEGVI